MQQKRLNLEKTIKFDTFQPLIGTVNRKNPVSFYVTGKTYITPKTEEEDYSESLANIEASIKGDLRRFVAGNDVFGKDFILNFEVSENGLKYGKNSYLFFQMFFTQKKFGDLTSIVTFCEPSVREILTGVRDTIESEGFEIVSNGNRRGIYNKQLEQ